jgi:hypothetical protein
LKEVMLGAAVMLSGIYFGAPTPALNIVMLIIPGLAYWDNYGPTPPTQSWIPDPTLTVAKAVRATYAMHQQYVLTIGVVLLAISLLIAGVLYFFMQWRANKSAASAGPTPFQDPNV